MIELLVAAGAKITRLIILFDLFYLAVEHLEDDLSLGHESIFLVGLFDRKHLGQILLSMHHLLNGKYPQINILL